MRWVPAHQHHIHFCIFPNLLSYKSSTFRYTQAASEVCSFELCTFEIQQQSSKWHHRPKMSPTSFELQEQQLLYRKLDVISPDCGAFKQL